MASTQRPRPRARKASADAPSLTSAAAGSSSLAAKASVSPNPDVNGGGGEDDNDDFFVRRKPASGIKTVSVPVGVFSRGSPMQHLAATEEENEFDDDGDDDDDDNEGSDGSAGGLSSDEGRKRKRPRRRQMPLWAKSTSLSKAEAALKLSKSSRLPLDSRAHTISTDSEGLRGEMKSKQRESRSPSLTPPPPLGKDSE